MTIFGEFINQGFSPANILISIEMWFIYDKFYELNLLSQDDFEKLCDTEVMNGYLEEVPTTHDLLKFYQVSRTDRFYRLSDMGKEITSIYNL
jgi:hypothetical protein